MDCTIYGARVLLVDPLYFRDRDHGLYVCFSHLHYETLAAHSYGPAKVGILSESPFWPAIFCRAVRSDTPRHEVPLAMNSRSRTSRDTATPISRPVYMIFRSFNLNSVIDTRPR
jgi:hypothetical protein